MIELKKDCCEVFPVIVPENSSLKTINFFLVKHGHSLSLIDAGWNNEDCWNSLINTLKQNGHNVSDLTEIILTHHHPDHCGLVNRINSINPIPVYAHPDAFPRLKRDKGFLEMRAEFYARLYEEMGCGENGKHYAAYLKKAIKQNKHLALEADILPIQEPQLLGFDIIEMPGHAPDQIAFYDKKQNWLFAGDLLIEHISSNALIEPDRFGRRLATLTQHIHSLKKCLALNVGLILPGHGILIENANCIINKKLNRTKAKLEKLIRLIRSGLTTGSDIAVTFYRKTYYEQFSLVMSEIIGHLDYLETHGRIEKKLINGVWHYRVAGE